MVYLHQGSEIPGGYKWEEEWRPFREAFLTGMDRDLAVIRQENPGGIIIVALHYPPLTTDNPNMEVPEILAKHGVATCAFGHLHRDAAELAYEGELGGVVYRLVAADHLDYQPTLLGEW